MSNAQKMILAVGLLAMALAALLPPQYHIGPQAGLYRSFLYSSDFNRPRSLNIEKLAVEWMFLASATASGVVFAGRRGPGNDEGR